MVTTPQKISAIDVNRAVSLYKKFHVPILGVIENMSYYVIPKIGERIEIFTGGGANKIASDHNLKLLTKLPIDSRLSIACDAGGDLGPFSHLLDAIKLP